jgi:dolichol-phosphate mannosyltransferase
MQIGVVIPTYNEAENLPGLVSTLFRLPLDLRLLVVDDNSPDGTGCLAQELAAANVGRMAVLHRPEKSGLASACIQGFRYFLDEKVEAIGQIDADFSHDPVAMIAMAKHLESCDLVLGSRYIQGGSVDKRWSFNRRNLSAWGNLYARHILGLPFQDITTGYRLWRFEALKAMPLDRIRSRGYVFQVELMYLAHRLDFSVDEIPIHFAERKSGKTKMSFQIQIEAALRIWQMPLTYRDIHCSDPNPALSSRQKPAGHRH